ncbi:MAG: phosphatidate cytidylyltransferase [Actinomycetales bacterium]
MDIIPKNRRTGVGGLLGRRNRTEPVIDLTEAADVAGSAGDDEETPVHGRRTARGRHELERGGQSTTTVVNGPGPTEHGEVGPPPSPDQPQTRAAVRAARQPSRAGRNLPAAVAVGLVLGVFVIASLFVRKEAFVVLATLAIVVAVWELTEALAVRGIAVPLVPVAVGAVGMLVAAFAAGGQALAVCFTLTGLGVIAWRVAEGHEGAVRDVAGGLFVAAYVPLLGGFTMLLLSPRDGPWRELACIILVVGSDTGGYVVGVLLGRHPMAPSVSPKKSWEGFAGSVAACVLLGTGLVVLFLDGSWWAGAVTGLAAVAAATVGDLGESLIKRDLGIKDMSSLLPGHGGVLDRIDSLLFAAPVVWLMLHALVPVS